MAIMCLLALLLTGCRAKAKAGAEMAAPTGGPVQTASLDEYVGWYDDGSYDTVVIEKRDDGYAMSVGLYRLTSLDEGTVTADAQGVLFHTLDLSGQPMTLSFQKDGDGYVLKVEESAWELLKAGTALPGFRRTTLEALAASYGEPDPEAKATPRPGVLPPYGEGQIGFHAVVLCETLTLRREPSAAAKAVGTLRYGDFLLVTRQENGWAEIFLSDAVDATAAGWVSTDYLAVDPAWYKTYEATPVYAWGDTAAPRVALLDAGVTLPILKDEGDWLVVSLRGAAGWVHVGD